MFREKLFIQILMWAHDRQNGFTRPELEAKFNFSTEEYNWVTTNFFNGGNPLFQVVSTRDAVDYYALTRYGNITAIDYIELKEAREGSKKDTYWAITSLIIAIITGIGQIVVGLMDYF